MKKLYFSLIFLFIVSSVIAQTTAIPDPNFEQALIDLGIDSDGVVNGQILTSDANDVSSLDVSNKNITDITGINSFWKLIDLDVSNNNLSQFYYQSRNVVEATGYPITLGTINLKNNNLENIFILGPFTSILIEDNPNLKNLELELLRTDSLLINNYPKLETIIIDNEAGNAILEINNNASLQSLSILSIDREWFDFQTYGKIEINNNPSLVNVNFDKFRIIDFRFLNNSSFTELFLISNSPDELDKTGFNNILIDNNDWLTKIEIFNALGANIEITNNNELIDLELSRNNMENIDNKVSLTTLTVKNNGKIKDLKINDQNRFSNILVNENENLESMFLGPYAWGLENINIDASNNKLNSFTYALQPYSFNLNIKLDISNNELTDGLVNLDESNNVIDELNVSNNRFEFFYLKDVYANKLIIEDCPLLKNLDTRIHHAEYPYIEDEEAVNTLSAVNNSFLSCIIVVDADKADAKEPPYTNWQKDDQAVYREGSCNTYIELSSDKNEISENNENAIITAKLNYVSPIDDVTVNLSTSGTAPPTNYELSSNTIVIPAGQLSASVTLTAIEDEMDSDKTVIIDIESIENGEEETPQQVTITIIHVNDPPTDIILEETAFEENITTDELTKIIVDDIDDTTHDITLVNGDGSDDNSDFYITGDILFKNIIFDYETKKEYFIRIKAEDSGGLFIEKPFIITVINVNDIVITGVVTNNYCNTGDISFIETTVTEYIAPLSYQWSSGETTANISGKADGTYILTVTDAENRVQSKEFVIGSEPIYADMSICYVTSDNVSPDNNRIYFNNQNAYNINKIVILREGIVAGLYDVIGTVNPDQSSFLDTSSDNQVVSYNYKVRVTDKCGDISESSALHKTVLLQANKAADGSINLNWNEYVGLNYGTYDIYRKENNQDYTLLRSLPSSNLSYNDTDATSNTKSYSYYIAITLNETCDFTVPAEANKSILATTQIKSNIKLVSSTLGVDDEILAQGLSLFPNPTNSTLHIESKIPLIKIEFYSILGQKVKDVNTDFKNINLNNLAKGIYLIRLSSEKGTTIKKLIKN